MTRLQLKFSGDHQHWLILQCAVAIGEIELVPIETHDLEPIALQSDHIDAEQPFGGAATLCACIHDSGTADCAGNTNGPLQTLKSLSCGTSGQCGDGLTGARSDAAGADVQIDALQSPHAERQPRQSSISDQQVGACTDDLDGQVRLGGPVEQDGNLFCGTGFRQPLRRTSDTPGGKAG